MYKIYKDDYHETRSDNRKYFIEYLFILYCIHRLFIYLFIPLFIIYSLREIKYLMVLWIYEYMNFYVIKNWDCTVASDENSKNKRKGSCGIIFY